MHIKNLPRRIKREAIHAWRNTKEFMHMNENFFRQARGCRIIVYHGICQKDHTKFNGIFLCRDTFENHLRFFHKYFHVVTLDEVYTGYLNENKFNICITFDDGYYNNYKYVLPLMEKYCMPISFFITAIRDAGYDILWNDYLGIITKYGPPMIYFNGEEFYKSKNKYLSVKTKNPLVELLGKENFKPKKEIIETFETMVSFRGKKEDEDFWQQMNIKDIQALATSPYSTIGAHGYYHNDLSNLSGADCRNELMTSKKFLENICGFEISALAFPYGHYSKQVVTEAKKAGYNKLLALDLLFSEDKTDGAIQERMVINPYINVINQMYAIVTGRYE